jgi:hypothetical protein
VLPGLRQHGQARVKAGARYEMLFVQYPFVALREPGMSGAQSSRRWACRAADGVSQPRVGLGEHQSARQRRALSSATLPPLRVRLGTPVSVAVPRSAGGADSSMEIEARKLRRYRPVSTLTPMQRAALRSTAGVGERPLGRELSEAVAAVSLLGSASEVQGVTLQTLPQRSAGTSRNSLCLALTRLPSNWLIRQLG